MLGLASYLSEFGWEPTILTAPLERPVDRALRANVIEVDYPGDVWEFWRRALAAFGYDRSRSITEQIKIKVGGGRRGRAAGRFRTMYQELFGFPDTERRWIRPAFESARVLAAQQKFDAVLSVWPVSSHLVARQLKRIAGIPWVADFPDPWSENHAYPYGRIRRFVDRWLERRVLADADAVTAATPGYARRQEAAARRPCEAILLGFEPGQVNEPPTSLSEKFTITYTGTIYEGMQDPTRLLDGVKELIAEGIVNRRKLEVRLFGKNHDWLRSEIERRSLGDVVVQGGVIPRAESLTRQRESQLLLLLGWEDRANPGVIPYKLFEYLAAHRPILIVGGTADQDIVRIVTERQAGYFVETVSDLKGVLARCYREFEERGSVGVSNSSADIDQFSYRTMARRFAGLLDKVAKR